jgi:trehalose 6-phosphate synthase
MAAYLRKRLDGRRLIVVANREPYAHEQTPDGVRCVEPEGGLVSVLDPVLRSTGGTWVAHGNGSGDRRTSDERGRLTVPPGLGAYTLRRVWLGREEEEGWYHRACHRGIWPLCHAVFHPPEFDEDAWKEYRGVNEKFAQAVVEEAGREDCLILVQNYHFALLPRILRNRLGPSTICSFWHLPWPHPDVFRNCPWKADLLEGMLDSDLVCFHLKEHGDSFLEAARREAGAAVDPVLGTARVGLRPTRVRPDPISVDCEDLTRAATGPETAARVDAWKARLSLGSQRVLLSVGRFDYTEGVPERIRAYARLLELHPEYRGRILLLEVAIPIRGSLPTYTRFQSEAVRLIEEVNRTYGTDSWQPVVVVSEHQPRSQLVALYRLADVCLVTSLHDGMSLVAKEYVSARPDGRGVLVLSQNSGAARELRDAVLVNPFDVAETAGALRHALEMPDDVREERSRKLRSVVESRNVFRWAGKLFKEALTAPETSLASQQDHGKDS